MKSINTFLSKIGLSDEFISEFLNNSEVFNVKKKEFFLKEGEVCKYVGILLKGSLITYFTDQNSDIFINELNLPITYITSYWSFLLNAPSKESIQATEDSTIIAISYEKYSKLSNQVMWLLFFRDVSDKLFLRKCSREKALNKYTAKERYDQLLVALPSVEQAFPQYIIASYLKIRPETLSRMKSLDIHQLKKK